jgi:hypothetical protein
MLLSCKCSASASELVVLSAASCCASEQARQNVSHCAHVSRFRHTAGEVCNSVGWLLYKGVCAAQTSPAQRSDDLAGATGIASLLSTGLPSAAALTAHAAVSLDGAASNEAVQAACPQLLAAA